MTTIVGGVAEWSKALVLGTSLKGRGFESHLHYTSSQSPPSHYHITDNTEYHIHTTTTTQSQPINNTTTSHSTRSHSVTCHFETSSNSQHRPVTLPFLVPLTTSSDCIELLSCMPNAQLTCTSCSNPEFHEAYCERKHS